MSEIEKEEDQEEKMTMNKRNDERKYGEGLRESVGRQMRFASEEERGEMVSFIEGRVPEFVKEIFGMEIGSVYDLRSSSEVRELRHKTAINPTAKEMDEAEDGRYGIALKMYADFLDSKFNPLKKKPKGIKTKGASTDNSTGGDKTKGEEANSGNTKTESSESKSEKYVEGAIVQSTTDKRERNPKARKACIEKYGAKCTVCGFDFEARYGDAGKGYIEVHHLQPISQTDDEHEVRPKDLVPLCANCHAMAHRRSPEPFTPEELKQMIDGQEQA